MYLSDIIRPVLCSYLTERFAGKTIIIRKDDLAYIRSSSGKEEEQSLESYKITCKSVRFSDDDGDCWVEFIDDQDRTFAVFGQGLDVWFEVEEEEEKE